MPDEEGGVLLCWKRTDADGDHVAGELINAPGKAIARHNINGNSNYMCIYIYVYVYIHIVSVYIYIHRKVYINICMYVMYRSGIL